MAYPIPTDTSHKFIFVGSLIAVIYILNLTFNQLTDYDNLVMESAVLEKKVQLSNTFKKGELIIDSIKVTENNFNMMLESELAKVKIEKFENAMIRIYCWLYLQF